MRESQLTNHDAIAYLLVGCGTPSDWAHIAVFADDPAVSDQAVIDAMTARTDTSPIWGRRLRTAPGDFDNPYWESYQHGSAPITRYEGPDLRWQESLDHIATEVLVPIDQRQCPWKITFHRMVDGVGGMADGVGGAEAPALVVVLHVSHAMLVGTGFAAITQSLYGDNPISAQAPSLPEASRFNALLAGLRSSRTLWRYARTAAAIGADRLLPAKRKPTGPFPTPPTLRPEMTVGSRRRMRCVRLDSTAIKRPGLSITVSTLTALSIAVERYRREFGALSDVSECLVQTKVDWPEMGVNQIRPAIVALRADIADVSVRAREIGAALKEQVAAIQAPPLRTLVSAAAELPYPLLRHSVASAPSGSLGAAMSSVRTEYSGPWSVAGLPGVFTAFALPCHELDLAVAITGANDSVAVMISAPPEIVEDIDRLADLVTDAFGEVSEKFGGQS